VNCKTTTELVAGAFQTWPSENDPHRTIHFFDPELVFESIDQIRVNLGRQAKDGVAFDPEAIALTKGLGARAARFSHDPADGKVFGIEVDIGDHDLTPQAAIPNFTPANLKSDTLARRQIASVAQADKRIVKNWGPGGKCEELRFAPPGTRYRTAQNASCKKGKEWVRGCDLRDYPTAQTCQMWFNLVE
jgi:hypothetical protein